MLSYNLFSGLSRSRFPNGFCTTVLRVERPRFHYPKNIRWPALTTKQCNVFVSYSLLLFPICLYLLVVNSLLIRLHDNRALTEYHKHYFRSITKYTMTIRIYQYILISMELTYLWQYFYIQVTTIRKHFFKIWQSLIWYRNSPCLWNALFYYRVRKKRLLVPILSNTIFVSSLIDLYC
jgi:hypothetical protein